MCVKKSRWQVAVSISEWKPSEFLLFSFFERGKINKVKVDKYFVRIEGRVAMTVGGKEEPSQRVQNSFPHYYKGILSLTHKPASHYH